MDDYFRHSKESPYHISIGAVLLNEKKEVCVTYFKSLTLKMGTFENFHTLMRETLHSNETLEQCLARGLMEEFGATATLKRFLGSLVITAPHTDYSFQKNTLYFLCDLISIDASKISQEDKDLGGEVVWMPIPELIMKMKEQKQRLGRDDIDESVILERIQNPYSVSLGIMK